MCTVKVSKMEFHYKSFCLLKYFVMIILFHNLQADVIKNCLCSTKEDATIFIDCHNVVNLHLDFSHFCPRSVKYNGVISTLDLSENNITNLPEDIFENSRDLKIINLSKNLLQEIHKTIFENLENLEVLNLSYNRITVIYPAILPSLQVLDLSNNMIKDLDLDFHKAYPKLTHLSLSNNRLDNSMNVTLALVRNLYHLDLSHNNFDFQDNEDFNFLSQLTCLNLSHNVIKSLSNQQFPDSLVQLNIGFNFLSDFPVNLSKIQILNIEKNQIKTITGVNFNFTDLMFINISGNYLENLPDIKFDNLKVFDLSNNQLFNIPETLNKNNYPVLETLILNENPINDIKFFSYLNLKSLKMSNLDYVKKVDEDSFSKLNQDTDICLNLSLTDNNKLQIINEKAFSALNLCYLDLQNNNLQTLPWEIFNSGLKANFGVDLEKNPFHCNCSMQWMVNDLIPWLYKTNLNLLEDLRCNSPEKFKGRRMVHFYNWTQQVFCEDPRVYSSRMASEKFQELLNEDNSLTSNLLSIKISNASLLVLVLSTSSLFILIMIGITMKKRASHRRSRINRRF